MGSQKKKQPAKKKGIDKSAVIIALVGVAVIAALILVFVLTLPDKDSDNIIDHGDHTHIEGVEDDIHDTASSVDMTAIAKEIDAKQVSDFKETDKVTEYVKISIKDHGDIVIRLREDIAPISVKNFRDLVADGFYNGLTFHRIIQNFMIQGGQNANVDVSTIKGEFSANGVDNDLLHLRGVISMARTAVMDSATSQFFICDATSPHLDGQYAAFGYVVAGLSTVDSVAAVTTNASDAPLSEVVMEKVCFVTEK